MEKFNEAKQEWQAYGTAFLIHHKINCLVTCRHVITGQGKLAVAYNNKQGTIVRVSPRTIEELLGIPWQYHSQTDVDIAAIPFGIDPDADDLRILPEKMLSGMELFHDGDEVFFLGFPFGNSDLIYEQHKVRPLIRHGVIALKKSDQTFPVDGFSWPGSSGSPVFLRPRINVTSFGNTLSFGRTEMQLVGIMGGHVPTTSTENTGLAHATGVDRLREILTSESFERAGNLIASKLDERGNLVR